MSSPEAIETTSSVYDSCDPKYLRELREASGMDLAVLARTACLSLAQVRQLESDAGGNLFYSLTIKRQAYKRLLMILGAEPPTVEIPEEFRQAHQVADAHLKTLDQIVAMSELPSMQRSLGEVLRDGVTQVLAHKQFIGAALLLLVAVALFMKLGPLHNLDAAPAPPPPVSTAAEPVRMLAPVAPPVAAVPTAAPMAETVATPVKSSGCAFTEDALPELTSYAANKAGRFVYLVSTTDAEICVVDGQKVPTAVVLKAGESRSVYGAAPWQISGAQLQKVAIYFQGGRVSIPVTTANRFQLIEVPTAR
jgi:hypothetical protein